MQTPELLSVDLSIAIPFLNEEENARRVVEEMVSTMKSHQIDYELILVNNGSRDRTGDIITELCESNPRLKPVHLIANAGYGGGIITGLHYCTGEYLGYTWGDNQIKAEDIVRVYREVQEKKLDWGKGYRTKRYYSFQRKVISKIYNFLFKIIFHAPTQDVNGVPKIFTRSCYKELDIRSTNWFIDAEIMLKSMDKPYRFGEVPVIFHRREGGSSNVNFLTVVEFVVNMIQYRWENRRKYHRNRLQEHMRSWAAYQVCKTYAAVSLFQGVYSIIRMVLVSFSKIESFVPKEGKILDLGCGNGLFSHYLHLTSPQRSIIGIDLDPKRVLAAQQTVNGDMPMEFFCKDVNQVDLQQIQTMTLIDLLHHMPYDEQEKLLTMIYQNLNNGGIVVIKDLQKEPSWKYRLHYVHDMVSYKGRPLYFRSASNMISMLEQIGFHVKQHNIDRWNIYPHIVYRCEKRLSTPSS